MKVLNELQLRVDSEKQVLSEMKNNFEKCLRQLNDQRINDQRSIELAKQKKTQFEADLKELNVRNKKTTEELRICQSQFKKREKDFIGLGEKFDAIVETLVKKVKLIEDKTKKEEETETVAKVIKQAKTALGAKDS